MDKIKRNILLNPGPSTTTDTVKMAQVVPDICPREKEFGDIMRKMRTDLVKIVHGDPQKYTSVLFCGSGTINLDVCINSLLPEGIKLIFIPVFFVIILILKSQGRNCNFTLDFLACAKAHKSISKFVKLLFNFTNLK